MYSISLYFDFDIKTEEFTGMYPYDSGFEVQDLNGNVLEYLYNGGVAVPNYLNYGSLSMTFLYKVECANGNEGIRLALSYFENIGDFPYSTLQVDTLVLVVNKIN